MSLRSAAARMTAGRRGVRFAAALWPARIPGRAAGVSLRSAAARITAGRHVAEVRCRAHDRRPAWGEVRCRAVAGVDFLGQLLSPGPGFRRSLLRLATRVHMTCTDLKLPVMTVSLGGNKTPGQRVATDGVFRYKAPKNLLAKTVKGVRIFSMRTPAGPARAGKSSDSVVKQQSAAVSQPTARRSLTWENSSA